MTCPNGTETCQYTSNSLEDGENCEVHYKCTSSNGIYYFSWIYRRNVENIRKNIQMSCIIYFSQVLFCTKKQKPNQLDKWMDSTQLNSKVSLMKWDEWWAASSLIHSVPFSRYHAFVPFNSRDFLNNLYLFPISGFGTYQINSLLYF